MNTSFRTRLILLFGGLFAAALIATFLAVTVAQTRAATQAVEDELAQDSVLFDRLLSTRTRHLRESARAVGSDFAFKESYADWLSEGDDQTLLSAMRNHFARLEEADLMVLLSIDGEVILTTEPEADDEESEDVWLELVYAAEDDDFLEAAAIVPRGGGLIQAVVVPLAIPDLEGWIAIGFRIDDEFVEEFQRLTRADVSIARASADGWVLDATTLDATSAEAISDRFPSTESLAPADEEAPAMPPVETFDLGDRQLITSFEALAAEPVPVLAVLQRPLQAELAPYRQIQRVLLTIFAIGLVLVLVGAAVAAGNVTQPVLAIADAASRIEKGEFEQQIMTRRRDEIGRMAHSFNHMAKGLAEKERVRNLLGKVVSPAIAEELMRSEIDLGGEEREVTILFSDVRSFTSLCEGRSPRDILELLNLYLTEVSGAISDRGGVVDKYIGDAVMALFGAPIAGDDDPAQAVRAARDMIAAVDRLNPEVRKDGWPDLEIGVGINTDVVVAGNMGSIERLNYTVIGDGVNLASRLEGLTKVYGLPILVTEMTAKRCPDLRFRELDRVRVKGKSEPVALYEPLDDQAPDPDDDLFAKGLALYRRRSWSAAAACFESFAAEQPSYETLSRFFLRRLDHLTAHPPDDDWDTTHTFDEK